MMCSECHAADRGLALQKRNTVPGAQLPAECSAPGVNGLKQTHISSS